ncbi:SSU0592/SSU0593 family protein [Streptococcus suis]|uniref:SSU0592/SSU0593 family protein n=1 Tax=Streptococcus suis TaxID=1307 RepID=UPI0005CE4342|nr:hypothetical protein [Streptococcus suis]MBL6515138.1 hypothetical protein [Streptococcus suis]MDX4991809.1 hypothetical protein [Streptococcus suis]MDY7601702.1 hypothetical protein [Streptococcus suis]NQH62379.1 hypothetical protein [Streptococcus suis]UTI54389.1 hypothetical protein NLY76_06140 [Streptococcus suis]
MKHIVTKRSYKVGACAMALALLMTTAGGAVVNAEQGLSSDGGFVTRNDQVLIEQKLPNQNFINEGIEEVEPINRSNSTEKNSSRFGGFWNGVKTFWKALCCGLGLPKWLCPSC